MTKFKIPVIIGLALLIREHQSLPSGLLQPQPLLIPPRKLLFS